MMITVDNLSYSDKNKSKGFLLENISFSLDQGYIMSLLGKNGSGKTTLLQCIYGIIKPVGGSVIWEDMKNFRQQVAYVGNESWCNETDTVNENIKLFSLLYKEFDWEYFYQLLNRMEWDVENMEKEFEILSSGQKMILQIAFVLARRPRLILMDEPMANLDPVIKTEIWDILSEIVRRENASIIISTHLVEEINDISDYIMVLNDGKMVAYGDREQLLSEKNADNFRELFHSCLCG